MGDSELDAIRQQRMAQMGGAPGGSKQPSEAERKKAAAENEKAKTSILTQLLEQDAMARLSTLQAAKPERAQQIEAMLIQMARSGRIAGKMNDAQFRNLLDQISTGQPQKKTTVKFDRRRAALDSDDEDEEDY
uniref:Programmed cell death protein 5 n=1 Tax=Panagrellus redivivus TaxID=6233 RepID=A0A7E4VDU9_PANRE